MKSKRIVHTLQCLVHQSTKSTLLLHCWYMQYSLLFAVPLGETSINFQDYLKSATVGPEVQNKGKQTNKQTNK